MPKRWGITAVYNRADKVSALLRPTEREQGHQPNVIPSLGRTLLQMEWSCAASQRRMK